jgi:hypothetical protein
MINVIPFIFKDGKTAMLPPFDIPFQRADND